MILTDAMAWWHDTRGSVGLLVEAYRGLCERGADTRAEKLAVVERLGLELALNAQVEHELLAPALRIAASGPSSAHSARDAGWALEAHLASGQPGDANFDARLLRLADELARRGEESGREIVRRAAADGLDLAALGTRMALRKRELIEARGPEQPEDESADPVGRPVSPALRSD